MIATAVIIWSVLFIVGASLFAYAKEEPEAVEPGPSEQDLMIIEFQARGRRVDVVCDDWHSLRCVDSAVEEAVRIRVVE